MSTIWGGKSDRLSRALSTSRAWWITWPWLSSSGSNTPQEIRLELSWLVAQLWQQQDYSQTEQPLLSGYAPCDHQEFHQGFFWRGRIWVGGLFEKNRALKYLLWLYSYYKSTSFIGWCLHRGFFWLYPSHRLEETTQLWQPFLIWSTLQSLNHLCTHLLDSF